METKRRIKGKMCLFNQTLRSSSYSDTKYSLKISAQWETDLQAKDTQCRTWQGICLCAKSVRFWDAKNLVKDVGSPDWGSVFGLLILAILFSTVSFDPSARRFCNASHIDFARLPSSPSDSESDASDWLSLSESSSEASWLLSGFWVLSTVEACGAFASKILPNFTSDCNCLSFWWIPSLEFSCLCVAALFSIDSLSSDELASLDSLSWAFCINGLSLFSIFSRLLSFKREPWWSFEGESGSESDVASLSEFCWVAPFSSRSRTQGKPTAKFQS